MQSNVTDHALRLLDQHRLHPCHTLQEEFLRHEHRNPKPSDIFKLRLHLPKTEYEEESADDDDDDVYSPTAAAPPPHQQQKKRSLVHEIQCDAAIKKAKILPGSMVISVRSLKAHLKTADPLSCPEWMELNLPVADIAQWPVQTTGSPQTTDALLTWGGGSTEI
ncbi:unnamed protein product [Sphagnum jensenii]|uniref:Uncharacterized protein n=2 Tax=Sphagnum jensenii TaxID=128206 RepID=A0ABP0ZY30_9BRYO